MTSLVSQGLIEDRHSTCVPSSHKDNTRACGNAPPLLAAARSTEHAIVGGAVGHIHHKAVQAHQAQPTIENAWHRGRAEQCNHRPGQETERCHAQPETRFAERRATWRAIAPEGLQPFEHLAIAIAATQRESDDEPNHEPSRQPQIPTVRMTGVAQDVVNLGTRDNPFESPQALGRRQLPKLVDLGV